MGFRDLFQTHRDLRHAEKNGDELTRRRFRTFIVIPGKHIGMDCGIAGGKTQIGGAAPVAPTVGGAVSRTDDITEFTDPGSHVALPELDQHIALDGSQAFHYGGHEFIHALCHRFAVASRIILFHCRIGFDISERIDEIQLESVQIPFLHGVFVGIDEIFTDIGEPGIQYIGSQTIGNICQIFSFKMFEQFCVLSHKRNGIPEDIFESGIMDFFHMRCHIRESAFHGLPVAAVGIGTAVIIIALPAIVHDQRFHPVFFGFKDLFFNRFSIKSLFVVAVPGGIQQIPGCRRCNCRFVGIESGKPVEGFPDGIGIKDVPGIDPDLCRVIFQRCFGKGEDLEITFQHAVLLPQTGGKYDFPGGFGTGERKAVVSVFPQKGEGGGMTGQTGGKAVAPVRTEDLSAVCGPAAVNIPLGNIHTHFHHSGDFCRFTGKGERDLLHAFGKRFFFQFSLPVGAFLPDQLKFTGEGIHICHCHKIFSCISNQCL